MAGQNYSNHRRFVAGYHFVLAAIVLLCLVGSLVQLYRAWTAGENRVMSALIVLLAIAAAQFYWYCRVFPLKAQDRAIRAEEKLRHYVLTGEMPDARLDTRQIIGLRFAGDGEFPALARRAAEEGMSEDGIKKAVQDWRGDTYRV
ncbi:MAG: DUF6526 family protein [Thermoanaerobaculia bacterium]